MIAPYVASTWCARVSAAWQLGVFVWLIWPHPNVTVWYAIVLAPAIVLAAAVRTLHALASAPNPSLRSRRAIFAAYAITSLLAPSFDGPFADDPAHAAILCVGSGALWLFPDSTLKQLPVICALTFVGVLTLLSQGNWPATIGATLVVIAQLWHAAVAYLQPRIRAPDETS